MAEYSIRYGHSDGYLSFTRLVRAVRKHWITIAAISGSVFVGVAVYTFTRVPLYESSASLLIDKNTIPVAEVPNAELEGTYVRDQTLFTEIAILKSRPLIDGAIARLQGFDEKTQKALPGRILANLTIKQEKASRILRLSYRDPNPQLAHDVLQALANSYSEYSLSDRRSKSANAIKFIEAKLPQVKKQLNKSAMAVTQFRKQYNIVDPDSYAASVYQMKRSLEQQAQELQIEMAQTERQFRELQRQVGKSVDTALGNAILTQDVTYQNLVKQFQDAETSYFLERTRFQESHPAVQVIKERRDRLYSLMQVQAETVLGSKAPAVGATTESSSLGSIKQVMASKLFETQTEMAVQAAQVSSIRQAQKQLNAVFGLIPQLQQSYTELQRQLTLDSAIFTKLSEKLEELRISEAQEISSWRLLDPPYLPNRPVSPNVLLNLILGGLAGIFVAALSILLLERLDERIREVEEVRELTDIPLLGAIPRTNLLVPSVSVRNSSQLAPSYDRSAFKEAIRSFALNLRYLGSDQTIKVIAFTSAIPSEGKSTLVYNLGLVLTELRHKVLIVDADMRKPTIHKLSRLRNSMGLSTAIATNRSWRQLVQVADPRQLLHILTSGPIPPNPIALLESTKMTKLMEVWRQNYDYVLIDTPPIVGISDAQSIATKVDSVVLVAAIERSTRSAIARAAELLNKSSDTKLGGILINMIDKTDSNYYYDYYSSYYQRTTVAPPPLVSEPLVSSNSP